MVRHHVLQRRRRRLGALPPLAVHHRPAERRVDAAVTPGPPGALARRRVVDPVEDVAPLLDVGPYDLVGPVQQRRVREVLAREQPRGHAPLLDEVARRARGGAVGAGPAGHGDERHVDADARGAQVGDQGGHARRRVRGAHGRVADAGCEGEVAGYVDGRGAAVEGGDGPDEVVALAAVVAHARDEGEVGADSAPKGGVGRGWEGAARGRGEGDAGRGDGNRRVDLHDGGGEDAVGAFVVVVIVSTFSPPWVRIRGE